MEARLKKREKYRYSYRRTIKQSASKVKQFELEYVEWLRVSYLGNERVLSSRIEKVVINTTINIKFYQHPSNSWISILKNTNKNDN